MTELDAPNIPESAAPEDVLKWMTFYLNAFASTVDRMASVLATEAHVESHPKAIVTLQRRARDMQQYSEMIQNYLARRSNLEGQE
jgi:hypothetical protein